MEYTASQRERERDRRHVNNRFRTGLPTRQQGTELMHFAAQHSGMGMGDERETNARR